ncbi:SDR family oxidoreductase [Leekyejoonella antrihumi]|uniref:SDR family oxidoreductase n=1 Tax=Leekyejoonella antrihumi TaxID=1660198 RepID=A0A563E2S9_9MICO|nr:SDR family oxidoreductase [Leekyejoonella antrihumi]TWP36502.1 SDR family oxidoreductase [Leekyejoonella antrihumi]
MQSQDSVLVTGAAAGIGRAIATRFARAGYRVAAFDVDLAGLESLRAAVPEDRLLIGELDVRDAAAWQEAVDRVAAANGGELRVLVNNAGVLEAGAFAQIPLTKQRRVLEVNAIGTLNGCHTAYPLLKATPGAHVLNLCSSSAIYGQAELATYSASKFAVRGLTEALDLEWASDDITVQALWPLFVNTGMVKDVDIASTRALGVHLTPEQVAEVALEAVSSHGRRPFGSVHRGVGLPSRVFMAAASISPSWANRFTNKMIGRR